MKTVRLTMAQALVRYLTAQKTVIDRKEVPLFAGVFAIFGHGNVIGGRGSLRNIVAFNGGAGVALSPHFTGNLIRDNALFANGGSDIDLIEDDASGEGDEPIEP